MAKKRTINEYRQTKEHYNPPHSHDKVLESKHVHKFTSDELTNFIKDFLYEADFINEDIPPMLLLEIKKFVSRNK